MDDHNSELVLAGSDAAGSALAATVEEFSGGTDAISIIVRHAFLEEAIIRRLADAVALGEGNKDAVFAVAAELVAAKNE